MAGVLTLNSPARADRGVPLIAELERYRPDPHEAELRPITGAA